RWQILIVKDGISSGWLGEYLSPEEALAIVNCMRNADELVQDVINIWGPLVQAGQAKTFTPEFKALVDAACEYRNAKRLADNHREFNILTEEDLAREAMTCELFARRYRAARPSESGKA